MRSYDDDEQKWKARTKEAGRGTSQERYYSSNNYEHTFHGAGGGGRRRVSMNLLDSPTPPTARTTTFERTANERARQASLNLRRGNKIVQKAKHEPPRHPGPSILFYFVSFIILQLTNPSIIAHNTVASHQTSEYLSINKNPTTNNGHEFRHSNALCPDCILCSQH